MMSSQQQLQLSSKDDIYEQQSDATPSMAKNDPPSPITKSSVSHLINCLMIVKQVLKNCWVMLKQLTRGECTVTEHSHGLPRRSILPEKAAGVPKFGSWDELNPSSDDGFTSIFNKARDSKRTGIETSGGDDSEPPPPRRGPTSSGNCSNESMHGGQDASDNYLALGNQSYFREGSEKEFSVLLKATRGKKCATSVNVDSTSSGDDVSEHSMFEPKTYANVDSTSSGDDVSEPRPDPVERGKRKRNDEFTTGNQIYFDNLWREGSEKDRSDPESVKQPGRPTDTKRHRWYQLWHIKR